MGGSTPFVCVSCILQRIMGRIPDEAESSGPTDEQNIEQNAQPNQRLNQQGSNQIKVFTLAEMEDATDNFDAANVLGEGGFGKVYKGKLQQNNQIVAIKKMDPHGDQGVDEYVVEIGTLTSVDHPNLVKLIGFCCQGVERMLVYEYLPRGSLDDHLHNLRPGSVGLDVNTRIKIAVGTARGLAYLHHEMNPPIIYRDLKSSNILLDEDFNAKLSDFGMAKLGPVGESSHVSTQVMGTLGYCAPEYALTGHLTFKCDIYSLGVMLMELITGRVALDDTKQGEERYIAFWARPMLEHKRNFYKMVDPLLHGYFDRVYKLLDLAASCVKTNPKSRPTAAKVLESLNDIAFRRYVPETPQLFRSASADGWKEDGVEGGCDAAHTTSDPAQQTRPKRTTKRPSRLED